MNKQDKNDSGLELLRAIRTFSQYCLVAGFSVAFCDRLSAMTYQPYDVRNIINLVVISFFLMTSLFSTFGDV